MMKIKKKMNLNFKIIQLKLIKLKENPMVKITTKIKIKNLKSLQLKNQIKRKNNLLLNNKKKKKK